MNNINDNNNLHECTSCGMCSAICPKNAIKMKLDDNGFYRPYIDSSLCVSCGICKKVCYKFDNRIENLKIKFTPICYSAKNKNSIELKNASSGALSIELMRKCIDLGYFVVGVSYDYNKDIAITKIAKSYDELDQFNGSKYMQSFTEQAFEYIVNDNSNQKYAIFGTPCQLYSFYKIAKIKNNRKKYIFIDIFCHGCPTLLLWKKYILEIRNKNNDINKIKFRSKNYGWHEYSTEFETQRDKKIVSSKINDPFYNLFFSKQLMNIECYRCNIRNNFLSDIRIGDFWGPKYDLDNQGVSSVIISTDTGNLLFDSIKDKFIYKKEDIDDVLKYQTYKKEYKYDEKMRDYLLCDLKTDTLIKTINKKYNKAQSLLTKIKRNIKFALKILFRKSYSNIRFLVHKLFK